MMKFSSALLLLLSALLSTAEGNPYSDSSSSSVGDDYYADDYDNYASDDDDYLNENERVVHTVPEFVSKQIDVWVNEGDTIKLPCLVDKLDGFILFWQKNDNMVALGERIITTHDKERFKVKKEDHGNTLEISLAEPEDGGEYKCAISSAGDRKELKHFVRIRVAPVLGAVPPNGLLVVREGETATLECKIKRGNPRPQVTWRRKEGRKMPTGEESIRGLAITYPSVSRHDSGVYICSADNGFNGNGDPVEQKIKLDVHHRPIVEQEQTFIHTSGTDRMEVVCTVHASPKAKVKWFKNGSPLSKEEGITSRRGNRHTLLLPGIRRRTFGDYECRASNNYGMDTSTTRVSGKAGPASVKTAESGESETEYALEWVAESITEITAFQVQLAEGLHGTPFDAQVRVAPRSQGENFYSGVHIFTNLRPGTHYRARIASINEYGTSEYGQEFTFGTKGAGPIHQPSTGAASELTASHAALVATMLAFALRSALSARSS